MPQEILAKIKKCHKYKDYETAIFLTTYLVKDSPEYTLLLGILLYENGEFSRCIYHLGGLLTVTSMYYCALAYKKQKKYTAAAMCAKTILDGSPKENTSSDEWYAQFFVSKSDTEFFDMLLGELYILKGRCRNGVEKYRRSMFKAPLLGAAEGLLDENHQIEQIDAFVGDPVMEYFLYISMIRDNIVSLTTGKRMGAEASVPSTHKLKDHRKTPFLGSYYTSRTATLQARFGDEAESLRLFEGLRKHDPFFIVGMDNYSTLLWKLRKESLLGLLAKEFIASHSQHHATWCIIGNYYSLGGHMHESTLCLQRSLGIRESAHAYALMGFESSTKNQYVEAQGYFNSSLRMLEDNDQALFGLGISYAETFKPEMAQSYFKRAMDINPASLHMKTYLIRFYVKNKIYCEAVRSIKAVLFEQRLDEQAPDAGRLDGSDLGLLVEFIENNSGSFGEMEELVLCELAEILAKHNYKGLARRVLESVECRTSAYFAKRAMIENE